MAFNPDKCLSIKIVDTDAVEINIDSALGVQWSLDGEDWGDFSMSSITLDPDQKVYLKGSSTFHTTGKSITASGMIELGGCIMSLLDSDGSGEGLTISDSPDGMGTFWHLFADCPVVSIPAGFLPATTLSNKCYRAMFARCSELTSLPENLLPASIVPEYAYAEMFSESSVQDLPENLIAGSEFGQFACDRMFNKSSVTAVSDIFSADTIECDVKAFYKMFYQCTSLTTISNLLKNLISVKSKSCDEMFMSCNIGELPTNFIPKLNSYEDTDDAFLCTLYGNPFEVVPEGFFEETELPSTTIFQGIFGGCSNLQEIHVGFTNWGGPTGKTATYNWVYGVAATGDFYCPEELEENYDVNHIPPNWNVIHPAPPPTPQKTYVFQVGHFGIAGIGGL